MAADGGKLMRRTPGVGEARQRRLAQPVKYTALRKSRGIAPRPKLVCKIVCAVALAAMGCQQREMANECRVNDCCQLGMRLEWPTSRRSFAGAR